MLCCDCRQCGSKFSAGTTSAAVSVVCLVFVVSGLFFVVAWSLLFAVVCFQCLLLLMLWLRLRL